MVKKITCKVEHCIYNNGNGGCKFTTIDIDKEGFCVSYYEKEKPEEKNISVGGEMVRKMIEAFEKGYGGR